MNEISPKHFYAELRDLERAFAQMKPEVELVVFENEVELEGYVVIWNTVETHHPLLRRAAKGGTRISPKLTLEEVREVAKTMALKNAAAGLPLGGAQTGIKADPDAAAFEEKLRRFIRHTKPLLCEYGGSLAGYGFDFGLRPIHAMWVCEELGSTRSFTGKPIELGGTDSEQNGLAGFGIAIAAQAALALDGETPNGKTFAVQGLGNVGSSVFRHFTQFGGVPKVIADPLIGGTYVFDKPLEFAVLESIIDRDFVHTKRLLEFHGYKRLPIDDALTQSVDIVFPCAHPYAIDAQLAKAVRAQYVVEGANNASSDAARAILFERAVTVVPDFIANPGAVIAAYVELTSWISEDENIRSQQNAFEALAMTRAKIAENVQVVFDLAKHLGAAPDQVARYCALRSIFTERRNAISEKIEVLHEGTAPCVSLPTSTVWDSPFDETGWDVASDSCTPPIGTKLN